MIFALLRKVGLEGECVVLGPGAEGVGGAVEEVGDSGGDVGGLADGGGPGVREHVDNGQGERKDLARFVGSQIFVLEWAIDRLGDDLELLQLGEGFGAGDDVVCSGVGLRLRVCERVSGDGGDIARVDGSSGSLEERPVNGFVVAEGGGPPVDAIGGEHAGADEGGLERSGFDVALDAGEHSAEGVGLLEERVRRLVGRGEEDEALRVFGDAVDYGGGGGGRGGPDKEDGVDIFQGGVEGFGRGEVTAEFFDGGWEIGGVGIAEQRADVAVC